MTQNQDKIQGKFYPLQHEEWLRECRELKRTELLVLYYIRTNDPHNQGIEINCASIARQLSSTKHVINPDTVSLAIKELVNKGYLSNDYLVPSTAIVTVKEVQ
jgi:DNA-binding MarR family transcriptional regulator